MCCSASPTPPLYTNRTVAGVSYQALTWEADWRTHVEYLWLKSPARSRAGDVSLGEEGDPVAPSSLLLLPKAGLDWGYANF
jgi:hypothetical protein